MKKFVHFINVKYIIPHCTKFFTFFRCDDSCVYLDLRFWFLHGVSLASHMATLSMLFSYNFPSASTNPRDNLSVFTLGHFLGVATIGIGSAAFKVGYIVNMNCGY